jgi:hypothetical protein
MLGILEDVFVRHKLWNTYGVQNYNFYTNFNVIIPSRIWSIFSKIFNGLM